MRDRFPGAGSFPLPIQSRIELTDRHRRGEGETAAIPQISFSWIFSIGVLLAGAVVSVGEVTLPRGVFRRERTPVPSAARRTPGEDRNFQNPFRGRSRWMINYWMLRTYGKCYDPWQAPIKVGMEEPWLVHADHLAAMRNGDAAMLHLMNRRTANGRKGTVIFAVGEIRTDTASGSNRDQPTPASAVLEYGSRYAENAVTVTVRYTKVLERPIPFLEMAKALNADGRKHRIVANVQPLSDAIEADEWPVIEALTR